MKHEQVFSRNSNKLGSSDGIKHKIKITKKHSPSEEVIVVLVLIEKSNEKIFRSYGR